MESQHLSLSGVCKNVFSAATGKDIITFDKEAKLHGRNASITIC